MNTQIIELLKIAEEKLNDNMVSIRIYGDESGTLFNIDGERIFDFYGIVSNLSNTPETLKDKIEAL